MLAIGDFLNFSFKIPEVKKFLLDLSQGNFSFYAVF